MHYWYLNFRNIINNHKYIYRKYLLIECIGKTLTLTKYEWINNILIKICIWNCAIVCTNFF